MPNITKGMQGALSKLPGSGHTCPKCDFVVPKYTGRYPGKCPECGTGLSFKGENKISRAQDMLGRLGDLDESKPKKGTLYIEMSSIGE